MRKIIFIIAAVVALLCCISGFLLFIKYENSRDFSKNLKYFSGKSVSCIGNNSARNNIIYFHGMDEDPPSSQENENRKILLDLAKKFDVMFALPRGNSTCKNKRCWNQFSKKITEDTFRYAVKLSSSCFKRETDFGVIGFSNGGYLTGKISHYCFKPQPIWSISIGSAGNIDDFREDFSLKNCTPIYLLIGKNEMTYKPAKKYFSDLRSRNANVELIEFDGGHEVPKIALENLLDSLLHRKFIF